MRRCSLLLPFLLAFTPLYAAKAPVTLPDILAWKRIQAPIVSADGHWFAYKLAPAEGDAEVILRNLIDGTETRFGIGEQPRPDPDAPAGPIAAPARDLAFSDDCKWLALAPYPTAKEAKGLKKLRKPIQAKAVLVELSSGKKTEFDGIRRFAFSGDRSLALALHRYTAVPAGPVAPPAAGAPKPEEKPQGADLLVHDLATGADFSIGNVSDFAFDKKGNWLAWLIDAQDKAGNGIQIRDLATGAVYPLDSAKASYKGLSWTEKGDALATLRGVEDKAWEDKLYAVVAFKNFKSGSMPEKVLYDPATDKAFPKGVTINPARNPFWMADLSAVTFSIHEIKAKDPKKKPEDDAGEPKPDMVIWHYKDSRLQPMQQVQEQMDKSFGYTAAYLPAEKKFLQLADAQLKNIGLTPDSKMAIGMDVREYELMGNLDGRRYQDVYTVNPTTGERKLALRKARWYQGASNDGSRFLYYDDGSFYTFDTATGQSKDITKGIPTTFIDTDDDHNVVKPPTRGFGFSSDGRFALLTDGWDIWKVPTDGSGKAVNLTVNGKKDKIRYSRIFRLDPDEKGTDLSKPLYIAAQHELTKQGGIGIVSPEVPGIKMPHWDNAAYMQLIKAKNADTYLYTREDTQNPPEFHSAGSTLAGGKKVTDSNPQLKDFDWTTGVKLVEYTGIKGDKLQAAIWLPANYVPGRKYPTLLYLYEKLTQATYNFPNIGYNGFSIGNYTSNGYAVIEPDITYRINDPGLSGSTAIINALKAAIATGIVDKDHVGIQGHSWGGYQTAFTVTQTDMFAAAVAGAPLTDMVSMYSSIYWNTGSANQPIFESSQGRFTGNYLEQTEAYIRNSPIYHATKVRTPLMILHNDKDGAVDHTQGIEYYNTLRRLQKPVVMLEYKGENHGLRKPENMKDYTVRMMEFFDHYLKDKPAPKWLQDGIPRLKMQEHLEEREKLITKTPAAVPATGGSNQ